MNFQVTVLKILVSYPDGFASMADLKRDMAILATSGRDWTERTKRLASRVPDLNIFSQGLIERGGGGWRISEKGRATLKVMEARLETFQTPEDASTSMKAATEPAPSVLQLGERANWRRERLERRRAARERARAIAS